MCGSIVTSNTSFLLIFPCFIDNLAQSKSFQLEKRQKHNISGTAFTLHANWLGEPRKTNLKFPYEHVSQYGPLGYKNK